MENIGTTGIADELLLKDISIRYKKTIENIRESYDNHEEEERFFKDITFRLIKGELKSWVDVENAAEDEYGFGLETWDCGVVQETHYWSFNSFSGKYIGVISEDIRGYE